jgi:transposase
VDTNKADDRQRPPAMMTTTQRTRRRFSTAEKREMVEQTLKGSRSVSVVARQYDVNANQLFRWRKQYCEGLLGEATGVKLLRVQVSEAHVPEVSATAANASSGSASGMLEVMLSNHRRIRITGTVCQQSLATVLRVLA